MNNYSDALVKGRDVTEEEEIELLKGEIVLKQSLQTKVSTQNAKRWSLRNQVSRQSRAQSTRIATF